MNRLDLWLTNPPEQPPCGRCGHIADDHEPRGGCGVMERGVINRLQYRFCPCDGYSDEPPERGPDARRDREREERLSW